MIGPLVSFDEKLLAGCLELGRWILFCAGLAGGKAGGKPTTFLFDGFAFKFKPYLEAMV